MQWIPYYWALLALISLTSVKAIEPNFEDIEEAKSESQNEVINIEQDSPHSNAIHIAHNIPTASDITVTQKNPYNSTVHIALNIGKDCKVKVDMSDAVNSMLHVSLSNPRNSQVEVTMNNAFNCSVHLSFQNPGSSSVVLNMDSPKMTQILVSQNVPYNSPMDVTINDPVDNAIHCSQVLAMSFKWLQYLQSIFQSASKGSPMTVTINGDNVEETNQLEIVQNAADEASILTCVPDCPQDDYVYDYQYSDNSGGQGGHSKPAPAPKPAVRKAAKPTPPATTAAPKPLGPPVYIDDSYGSTNYDEYENDYDQEYVDIEADLDYESHSDYDTAEQSDYEQEEQADYDQNQQVDYQDVVNYDTVVPAEQESENPVLPSDKYSDYDYTYDYAEEEPPQEIVEPAPAPAPAPAQDLPDDPTAGCPGGDLETCIDVCPGFNKVAFGLCVTECGKRCP